MNLQPHDFTFLAAAQRLFPHAAVDPSSVEGPYCAVRPDHKRRIQPGPADSLHIRLFDDLMEAEAWARGCPCGSASPESHFVRVIEPLEPADTAAFRNSVNWTQYRAAELLQKWACLAERLARGPATEAELNETLAAAEASGKVSWLSSDPISSPPDCRPALCWAHSNKMVKARYRDDLSTIEFTL
jgi:hypothetical protein